ncbi:MAG: response regulator [Kiritimatiellia bacterium]
MAGTILMVEDNPTNMKLFSLMLESVGHKVLWAESGELGLPMAEQEKPDLILMDIGLPGMDGLEATRRLKQNPLTSAIPVIAVTAHSLGSDRDQALRAGCSDFMAKPVRMKNFLDCIQAYMPADPGSPPPP